MLTLSKKGGDLTSKKDILKYAGSLQQVAYVRKLTQNEGRAKGLGQYEIKNGLMRLTVMEDKCLDISCLEYGGINMNFLSKPGLVGRNHFDTHGEEAVRSIMGGLMFTSGVENICAPCTIDGQEYPMHGRMRTTPAEHLSAEEVWNGDELILTVKGEMREAALFGENIVLNREIKTVYGTSTFTITDEFENQAFREEPLMLLYHINMGYPFLDEHTEFYIPTAKVTPRDAEAEGHENAYNVMEEPKDNEPEYVFIHDIISDEKGYVTALVVNRELELGLKLKYPVENLPYFMQWKTIASGDYCVGLEPANSSVYGRPFHEADGSVHKIGPFEKETFSLEFSVLSGLDAIESAVADFKDKYKK